VKTLLYGIGNVSRGDDAVGILCAERIGAWCAAEGLDGVEVDATYQLQIEDAARIAEVDRVIFLDASVLPIRDIHLEPLVPVMDATHSTHAVSPGCVLALCRELYDRTPEAYALHIRGYAFELGADLQPEAAGNLDAAVAFLREFLVAPATVRRPDGDTQALHR
jgi:hydrogenase maturation protease